MINIDGEEIFIDALKTTVNLPEKIIKAVGVLLALFKYNACSTTKNELAEKYAKNLQLYLKSKTHKNYTSGELAIAALGIEGKENEGIIKSLSLMKSNPVEVKLPKIAKKQLIKI